jgi:glyoxylase-like metal-dependent hydrolase (beta-lactamase superfamily II)
MRILSNTGGIAYTNCYLVIDDTSRDCVLFDAPDHTAGPLLDYVRDQNLNLLGLWLTHGHFDHLADHPLVRERFPAAKILIHRLDEPKLLKPGSRMFPLPFVIPPGKADGYVAEGDRLSIGSLHLTVLETPGHSPGHVAFHFPEENVLIGGDLIIGGSVGRTDLPDSDHAALERSVRRIMALPPETQLYAGHGEPSTLADELRTNDYVRQILSQAG